MQPIEICTHAWNGLLVRPGRWAEKRRSSPVPKADRGTPKPPAPSQSAEMVDRSRAESDVDKRIALEQPIPLRLGVAAADGDDRLWVARLRGARVPEVRCEPLVGLLADRAGVEDEHVGLLERRGLSEAELLERATDPLGVVRVHLTAERRDVVAPHFAYSIARDSRITVTLIWPGYSRCCSISRAISCERSAASSSAISSGLTMTRISRPACSA